MWGRRKKSDSETPQPPTPLKEAMREARIEAAERSAVIVDLRDAEVARLELLNEALDPLFAEIPKDVELFDRGVSRGETPRLWVDVVSHVEMGRDKRQYRFVQDTRYGRAVLTESYDVPEMVSAVTRYVARRLLERDRALADDVPFGQAATLKSIEDEQRRGRLRGLRMFVYGAVVAVAALFTWALLTAPVP
ncbi:hypothetical protein [Undibacter mobilis]|uniref:Uncharacterized protein n=1 Tax=Undibacter mobilis TaxID=2292256 RepID=A0A371B6T6_9BRAD|nr:hypothetical protein [Undibacter mobilis]RDV03111.1 hypothetical protein DXH78_00020 [Undibacter mobilis]